MTRFLKIVAPIALLAAALAGGYLLWATRPEVAAKPTQELARAVAAVTVEHRRRRKPDPTSRDEPHHECL